MSKFVSNSFQVPNAFVDDILNQLSGNACKIYLLIVRKTRGWHKEADRISYSQIQKFTGVNSRTTISKALDELLDLGLIIMQNGNEKSSNEYRLNDGFASPKNGLDKNCTSPKNGLASPKNGLEPSPKNGHTEIHIFKNTNTKDKSEYDTHESENFKNSQNPSNTQSGAMDNEFLENKQSKTKTKKPKNQSVKDYLLSLGVENQIAEDFIYFRQEIKKPLTVTAINRLVTEVNKTELGINSAIEFTLDKGWQSFTAEYYFNHTQGINHANRQTNPSQSNNTNGQYTNPVDEYRAKLMAEFNAFYGSNGESESGQSFSRNVYDMENEL